MLCALIIQFREDFHTEPLASTSTQSSPDTLTHKPQLQTLTIQRTIMPFSDPTRSYSQYESSSSGDPTPVQSMLNSEISNTTNDSITEALTPELCKSDEDIQIPEDKFAHRIQPFSEPCLILCHWMLYTWGTVITLGCLYALGLGEGQMRGRENLWVDVAVGLARCLRFGFLPVGLGPGRDILDN